MILVDSCIPMYIVGADHPLKSQSRALIERLLLERERLVSDAEVLQEILHRYGAIRRTDAIQPAFTALLDLVDEVFPVRLENALRAREILLAHAGLSARDAIHLAVMEAEGVTRILSFDGGFDGFPGVSRIH